MVQVHPRPLVSPLVRGGLLVRGGTVLVNTGRPPQVDGASRSLKHDVAKGRANDREPRWPQRFLINASPHTNPTENYEPGMSFGEDTGHRLFSVALILREQDQD